MTLLFDDSLNAHAMWFDHPQRVCSHIDLSSGSFYVSMGQRLKRNFPMENCVGMDVFDEIKKIRNEQNT
jgi:hypothetical protein